MPSPITPGTGRRRDILEAARGLVVEVGVRGMTMRALARRVGFTEGAIYRHFESKEELVDELFTTELARLESRLSACVSGRAAGGALLDGVVGTLVDFSLDEPESFRIVAEVARPDGALPERDAAMWARLPMERVVMANLATSGGEVEVDPGALALMIVGMVVRLATGLSTGVVRMDRSSARATAIAAVRAVVENARRSPDRICGNPPATGS